MPYSDEAYDMILRSYMPVKFVSLFFGQLVTA